MAKKVATKKSEEIKKKVTVKKTSKVKPGAVTEGIENKIESIENKLEAMENTSAPALEEKRFKLEGLMYIPYVIGWVLGIFNIIFWAILLIVGLVSEDKHKFIDYTLHKFVYIYGIVMMVLLLMFLIIFMLLLMLGITVFWPSMMMFR